MSFYTIDILTQQIFIYSFNLEDCINCYLLLEQNDMLHVFFKFEESSISFSFSEFRIFTFTSIAVPHSDTVIVMEEVLGSSTNSSNSSSTRHRPMFVNQTSSAVSDRIGVDFFLSLTFYIHF